MMARPDDVAPFAIDPALPPALPRDGRPAIVTVGTFDGVHRGHWEVLQEICRRARATGGRSILVTFHPHPLRVVRPEHAPPLLTTLAEKREVLAESGLEYVVFLPFTRTLQRYPARRFVEEILLGRIGMKELVIGYDHGFGRDREGSVETLRADRRGDGLCRGRGGCVPGGGRAGVVQPHPPPAGGGRRARRPRGCWGGRTGWRAWWSAASRRGASWAFPPPTSQVGDPEKMLPKEGVYAAYGWVDGERVPGCCTWARGRPFPASRPRWSCTCWTGAATCYGRPLRVEVVDRIRDIAPVLLRRGADRGHPRRRARRPAHAGAGGDGGRMSWELLL